MTSKYKPVIDPSLQMSMSAAAKLHQRAADLGNHQQAMQAFSLQTDESGSFVETLIFAENFINELAAYVSPYEFLDWACDHAKDILQNASRFLTSDDFHAAIELYRRVKMPAIEGRAFVKPGIHLEFMLTRRVVQVTIHAGALTGPTQEADEGFFPIETHLLILALRT